MFLSFADRVRRPLKRVSQRLVLWVPLAMVLGLAVGLLVDMSSLKTLVLPLTILMVYPMLVNFKPSEALRLTDTRAIAIAMALNFVALPVLAWGLASVFFGGEPQLFVGLLLIGLFPTSGMTISWTGLANGNVGAAVKMTVLGLLLAAVLAPFYLYVLAGTVVDVDILSVARTIMLVVLVPMGAGVLTRTLLVRRYGQSTYKERLAPIFPGMSTLGVLAIVFLAIGLKAPMIIREPQLLARIAIPLVAFYVIAFALATIVGRVTLSRSDAVAAVYGSVMRNLSIALGIAIASFGPEAALVLAAGYIVQVQGAAWYVRFADKLLCRRADCGPEPEPATS